MITIGGSFASSAFAARSGSAAGAFAGIHQQHDAVHHLQSAFDLASEVAVAGCVHDVDLHIVIEDGGVLGQNGDAALALQVIGVHDPLDDVLIGAESAALLQHSVNQRGLAVVNVGDNGDVADAGTQMSSFPISITYLLYYAGKKVREKCEF